MGPLWHAGYRTILKADLERGLADHVQRRGLELATARTHGESASYSERGK